MRPFSSFTDSGEPTPLWSGFLRGLEYEGTPSNVTFAVTGVVVQAFTDSEENKMSYNEALENLPRAWNSFSDREGDVAMSRLHFKLFSTEKLREHFLFCRHPCSWVWKNEFHATSES